MNRTQNRDRDTSTIPCPARMTSEPESVEQLKAAKEYVENLMNSSLDVLVSADTRRRITGFNRAAEQTFGYGKAEVLGRPVEMLYADRGESRYIQTCILQNGTFQGEIKNKRKDGTLFDAYLSASLIRDAHGKVIGVMGISRDITTRKQAERELRQAHQELSQLLEAIPSILIGLDTDARITWWNAAAQRVFGLPAENLVGQPLHACGIPWNDAQILAALADCRQSQQPVRLDDLHLHHPDGKERLLGITIMPMQGTSADEIHFLLLGADITDRRHMESRLAQAEKLESIGQLAAGIAHEINTPIQFVGDNIRFLQDAFDDLNQLLARYSILEQKCKAGSPSAGELHDVGRMAEAIDLDYLRQEVPRALAQSLDGVERVAKIVRAMKEFSHPGSEDKSAIDLNKAIDSTLTVARNEWKYVADVVTDFDPALPLVPCVPGAFNQVVLNIVVNAAQALGEVVAGDGGGKGTITVQTRRVEEWAEVRIGDTGPGIPESIRDKIFDPFFTTKEVGRGTGQGLAIAHDVVVQKHGGSLSFETEVGRGTTFIIRLPLEECAVAQEDAV